MKESKKSFQTSKKNYFSKRAKVCSGTKTQHARYAFIPSFPSLCPKGRVEG